MNICNMKSTIINNHTYIGIVADGSEKITLKVLDIYGKMTKTIQTQIEDGMSEMMVNLSDLKMGNYVVNAFCGERFLKAIRFSKEL